MALVSAAISVFPLMLPRVALKEAEPLLEMLCKITKAGRILESPEGKNSMTS